MKFQLDDEENPAWGTLEAVAAGSHNGPCAVQ